VPPHVRRRADRFGEQCERILTSNACFVLTGAACVVLAGWGLFVQLPRASETRVVAAREQLAALQQKLSDSQALPQVDQGTLSNQVAMAERFLIQKRDDLVPLVSDIERLIRQQGWKGQVSVRPPVERLSPVETVAVHPASIRIEPVGNSMVPPYRRLLSLLERLDRIPQKVEVVGVSVSSESAARFSAQLELQLWVRKPNEKPAPK
jgi:hypothetical protein